jgi:hypothetical protein
MKSVKNSPEYKGIVANNQKLFVYAEMLDEPYKTYAIKGMEKLCLSAMGTCWPGIAGSELLKKLNELDFEGFKQIIIDNYEVEPKKNYKVEIKEILSLVVTVEATTPEEAINKATEEYYGGSNKREVSLEAASMINDFIDSLP